MPGGAGWKAGSCTDIYTNLFLSLPQTRARLPALCDWLKKSEFTIWCTSNCLSVSQNLNCCFQSQELFFFVCLLTKSQDSRKWSFKESRSGCSDLVAVRGH